MVPGGAMRTDRFGEDCSAEGVILRFLADSGVDCGALSGDIRSTSAWILDGVDGDAATVAAMVDAMFLQSLIG